MDGWVPRIRSETGDMHRIRVSYKSPIKFARMVGLDLDSVVLPLGVQRLLANAGAENSYVVLDQFAQRVGSEGMAFLQVHEFAERMET